MPKFKRYEELLAEAWTTSKGELPTTVRNPALRQILVDSTHKTYKYVLVNALLGAATRWHNPLVLQAGSTLERPWDARSVCHRVLVPFERDHMEGRLGRSNEPFLNKPARFPELSEHNAVRRGSDQRVLNAMIALLGSIRNQDHARLLLVEALHLIRELQTQSLTIPFDGTKDSLPNQVRALLTENIEGEILTFVSGLILRSTFDLDIYRLRLHPMNQSGASSNEIADIDIVDSTTRGAVAGFEVKDKDFTPHDFTHAREKCYSEGVRSFKFITRGRWCKSFARSHPRKFIEYRRDILPIETLLLVFDYSFVNLRGDGLQKYVAEFVAQVRPKPETCDHLKAKLL